MPQFSTRLSSQSATLANASAQKLAQVCTDVSLSGLGRRGESSLVARVVLLFICLLVLCAGAAAQTGEWTWMGGSSTVSQSGGGQLGVYGTLGTPAAGNFPGSRSEASYWTDGNGNLWLFGGEGFDANGNEGRLNDLWEFNPQTNLWAWMGGGNTGNRLGVYGALGTPAAENTPGGRDDATSWTDGSGNLWLFGGNGSDSNSQGNLLNDLWEFNPQTKLWTWMGGSNSYGDTGQAGGVYGVLGTPASGNTPGSRYRASSWTDSNWDLWLFGGHGTDASGGPSVDGNLNDLWELNPRTAQWTWMGGSSTPLTTDGHFSYGQPAVYGVIGTPAPGNTPGGRSYNSCWTDSNGNFWLFGGDGFDSSYLNDLWEFNPQTNLWTWMGENTTVPDPRWQGFYGTLGTPAAANFPGGREYASDWTDSSGNLWLFGGLGFDASGNEGVLNDLWEFNPQTDQWTWMGGSSTLVELGGPYSYGQPGVYGTLGSAAAGNVPGSRRDPANWTDRSGHLWLFGGMGLDSNGNSGFLNDLWRYQLSAPSLPAATTPTISPSAGTYTASQTVTILDATAGAAIFYTTDGTTPTTGSAVYDGPITVSSSEKVEAIATSPGYSTSAVTSAAFVITPPVAPPTFSVPAGAYLGALSVTISDAAPGAIIFYTINGTAPTTNSTVYTGAITVSASETLNAVALAPGYSLSAVATAAYTISSAAPGVVGEWTWMGGSSTVGNNEGQPGVYGILGTPAPEDVPGGRDGAASWTDSSGNLWLFGGDGKDVNGDFDLLNDFWEFSPTTNEWAWMGGSSVGGQHGVYGTLGTQTGGNIPGARYLPTSLTDVSGNLWLFGGSGVDANGNGDVLNDLWEFNPSTGQWAWMGGSSVREQPAVYGTLGVPSIANVPGGRFMAMSWTDSSGNFWLFGGDGYSANAQGQGNVLNDLWEFNAVTREWTWIGGSSAGGQPGVYGTLATPAYGNTPGSRELAASWTDRNGNFWLYGGIGYDASGNYGYLSDLWKFNSSLNQWAWMGGNNNTTGNSPTPSAVYGTLGTPAAGNTPGGRAEATSWTDSNGNFWLFGGDGNTFPNDLWELNPTTLEWTWMSGSSENGQPGVYGILGTPALGNLPGSRYRASGWTDRDGNLWLFGGVGPNADHYGTWLNDLWEYRPPAPTPAAATPTFSVPAGTYTSAQTVSITDATIGATIYYTTNRVAPTTNSSVYGGPILVSATETLEAMAVATCYSQSPVAAAAYTISPPVTPSITWVTPAAITYGTTLSAIQLNASASVPGTYAYSPSAGALLSAGSHTLSVTFTPSDTASYTTTMASVSLLVNQAAPALAVSCGEVVYNGNPHTCSSSATGLNGAVVSGTWSLSPASATSAGSYPVTGTFASTDSNYYSGTAGGTLKIDKATPVITWASPASIPSGTALSATQLNASTPVAGSFAYNPTFGALLSLGSHNLSATFTPTDTADFNIATANVTLLVAGKATPAITWATPAAITYGTALSGTQLNAASTVAGTFAYSPAAGTILSAGQQTLSTSLTPKDTADYTSATATVTLTVNPAPVSMNVSCWNGSFPYGANYQCTVHVSAGAGSPQGSITYSFDGGAAVSVALGSGSAQFAITKPAVGNHTVVVAYAQQGNFAAAAAQTESFTVAPAPVVVQMTPSTYNPKAGSSVTFAASVTSSAAGTPNATGSVSFTDGSTLLASVTVDSGGNASFSTSSLSVGNHAITATYSGGANYGTGLATHTITVAPASQTITFTVPASPVTYGVAPITLVATASSGLTVTFSASGPATVNGSTLTVTGVGTVVITASQSGNASYSAAPQAQRTIVVNQAAQAITFTAPASPVAYGVAPITLVATGGASGKPVTFSVTGPASVNGNTLTVTGVGTVVVKANQAGNNNYAAAAAVQQTIVVNKAVQTITFTGLPATAVLGAAGPYTLSATDSSGLPVTYSVSGPATLNGATLKITGGGTVKVTANQAGNASYAAANPVAQSIVITAGSQTITFTGLPATATFGSAGPYSLNATASSGLAVSFSVSGPATAVGTRLALTGAGMVTVTASQAGNKDYSAATPVSLTIVVSAVPVNMNVSCWNASLLYGANYQCTVHVSGAGSPTGSITYALDTAAAVSVNLSSGSAQFTIATPAVGSHTVVVAYAQQGNFAAAPAQTETFTVSPASVSVQLTPSTYSATAGTNITFAAAVTSSSAGAPNATGSVSFTDGNTLLATIAVDANGRASYTTSSLSAGSHTITATYSGGANYGSGSASKSITLAPVNMNVSCWNSTFPYGGNYQCSVGVSVASGAPTGSLTYRLDNGTAVAVPLGSGSTTFTITKPAAGNHSLTLAYTQQGNSTPAATQAETFTVTPAPAAVQMTPSTYYASAGTAITFAAAVTSSSAGVPNATGSVSFTDGNTPLATIAVDANGVANYSTSSLSTGSHTITAAYSGGVNYGTGSATHTITIAN